MPAVASTMPPMAGPITAAPLNTSWFIEIAAGSRSGGTSRGMADARVGWSTAPKPAATNATAYSAMIGGAGCMARMTRARLVPASPIWVTSSMRRRSTASATAPPPSANSMIGTSWTSDSTPRASRSDVST